MPMKKYGAGLRKNLAFQNKLAKFTTFSTTHRSSSCISNLKTASNEAGLLQLSQHVVPVLEWRRLGSVWEFFQN